MGGAIGYPAPGGGGMGECSPEREEWGNPGLEQEGSSLELGGNPELEEKEVPLGGYSKV